MNVENAKEKAQINNLSKFSDKSDQLIYHLRRFSISRMGKDDNSRMSVHQRLARMGERR